MKKLKWRKGCPSSGDPVLFVSDSDGGVWTGYWCNHYMLNHNGNEMCHSDEVERWVPLSEVESLIEE